ncbi:hypothetical protein GCM10009745_72360 [Kribbella yunnanensis]|uniref:XRE family transcriptional regulator n=1 Tax=Kribbella yunnanensis TaxID=190194 RepID=A0ABP4UX25_9ACTN
MPSPNTTLREARLRIPSPADATRPMSRAELAHSVCVWLWHTRSMNRPFDAHYLAKLERGAVRRTGDAYREALRAVLGVPDDSALGMDQ